MQITSLINIIAGLVLAPLLLGVINKTKAHCAGRTGQPLLQAYYDIIKQLQKGVVYSKTTTWIFRAGPVVGLSAVLVALAIVPPVSYTHLRAHETGRNLVCRLLLE